MGMKQKKTFEFFFEWPTKKIEIVKTDYSQKKLRKFQGLVLGLVGLIDLKGLGVD